MAGLWRVQQGPKDQAGPEPGQGAEEALGPPGRTWAVHLGCPPPRGICGENAWTWRNDIFSDRSFFFFLATKHIWSSRARDQIQATAMT